MYKILLSIGLFFFFNIQQVYADINTSTATITSQNLLLGTGSVMPLDANIPIGSKVAGYAISRGDGTNTRTDTFYTTNAPRLPSQVEAAAGFAAGFPHVAPPSVGAPPVTGITITGMGSNVYPDNYSACLARVTAPDLGGNASMIYAYATVCDLYYAGSHHYYYFGTITTCASGYSVSGSTCVLSSADSVKRPLDGFCPIIRNGNAYASDTTDPDCASTTAAPQFQPDGTWNIKSADGRTVSGSSPDANGQTKIKTTEPTPDGNTKIVESHLQKDPSPANPDTVSGQSTSTIAGTGDAANSSVSATQTQDLSPVVNAIGNQMAADAAWRAKQDANYANDRTVPTTNETVSTTDIPVSVTSQTFSSNATCPAPIPFTLFGKPYAIPFDTACNFAGFVRPIILSLGAFGATFIFIGGLKS